MNEFTLFTKFIEKIQSHPIQKYKNEPRFNRKQASVVILFRLNPKKLKNQHNPIPKFDFNSNIATAQELNAYLSSLEGNVVKSESDIIQILYIKRAIHEKDVHSGEIAFPGGKCEEDELDDIAGIREVYEEIGLDLNDKSKFINLGKFPKNFFTYPTSKGNLYVSVHLFFQIKFEDIPFKLNPREVQKCIWVNLNSFLKPDISKLRRREVLAPPKWGQNLQMSWMLRKSIDALFSGLEGSNLYGYHIENNEILYGLTFYMTIYMLRIMKGILIQENPKNEVINKDFAFLTENCLNHELIYSSNVTWIKKKLVQYGYYLKRQKQYENITNEEIGLTLRLLIYVVIIMVIYKYIYLPQQSRL